MVEGGPREEKKGFLPSWRKEQHSHVSAVVRGRKQVKGGLNEDGTTFVNEGRCSWNPKQQQTAFSVCVFFYHGSSRRGACADRGAGRSMLCDSRSSAVKPLDPMTLRGRGIMWREGVVVVVV